MSKNGRLAIVTGAAGGIGIAVMETLARAGYAVAAWDKDISGIEEHVRGLIGAGLKIKTFQCDVSSEAEVNAAAEASEQAFGVPYLLVNNAAMRHSYPLEKLPREAWDRELAVNLTGMFQCTQTVGRRMLEQGVGVIVNMSSVTANVGMPMRGAYSPSKAGILGLTNTTALEWGPRGIRCNAISPGMIATPAHDKTYLNPGLRKKREEAVPLGRVGNGSDVADVVVFLASDSARFINGVDLPVDGGLGKALITLLPIASASDPGTFTTQLEQLHEMARNTEMKVGSP